MSSPADQLLELFESLSPADRASLLAFAEFLAQRSGSPVVLAPVAKEESGPAPLPEPKDIPRPESEKVIMAVKRLSQTYFMLDKTKMLGHTSGLMTQHILHGREAVEVIDELEEVFRTQYEALREQHGE